MKKKDDKKQVVISFLDALSKDIENILSQHFNKKIGYTLHIFDPANMESGACVSSEPINKRVEALKRLIEYLEKNGDTL